MDWLGTHGQSTIRVREVCRFSETPRTMSRSRPNFLKLVAVAVEEVGRHAFEGSLWIHVCSPSVSPRNDQPKPPYIRVAVQECRISVITYFGVEGLGALDMETDEDENVISTHFLFCHDY